MCEGLNYVEYKISTQISDLGFLYLISHVFVHCLVTDSHFSFCRLMPEARLMASLVKFVRKSIVFEQMKSTTVVLPVVIFTTYFLDIYFLCTKDFFLLLV